MRIAWRACTRSHLRCLEREMQRCIVTALLTLACIGAEAQERVEVPTLDERASLPLAGHWFAAGAPGRAPALGCVAPGVDRLVQRRQHRAGGDQPARERGRVSAGGAARRRSVLSPAARPKASAATTAARRCCCSSARATTGRRRSPASISHRVRTDARVRSCTTTRSTASTARRRCACARTCPTACTPGKGSARALAARDARVPARQPRSAAHEVGVGRGVGHFGFLADIGRCRTTAARRRAAAGV
jgi:hypothetical protein